MGGARGKKIRWFFQCDVRCVELQLHELGRRAADAARSGAKVAAPKHVRYTSNHSNVCFDNQSAPVQMPDCENMWAHRYNAMDMNTQTWASGRSVSRPSVLLLRETAPWIALCAAFSMADVGGYATAGLT